MQRGEGRRFVVAAIIGFAAIAAGLVALDAGGLRLTDDLPPAPPPPARSPAAAEAAAPPGSKLRAPITDAWHLDAAGYDGGEAERLASGAGMLVYFHATRCKECRALERGALASPAVRGWLGDVVKVRVATDAGAREQALARRFGVDDVPALVWVPASGGPRLVPLGPRPTAASLIAALE
jgi:thiol:disulfide interchange protein